MPEIFLGTNPQTGEIITAPLDKGALTVAGPRSGKGAAEIIQTLLHCADNVVVVDPKGEAWRKTAAERHKRFGQKIIILDPIPDPQTGGRSAPEAFRGFINPLDLVRGGGAGWRDIEVLADGIVMVSGRESDPFWNDSARTIIAGLIAYILEKHG